MAVALYGKNSPDMRKCRPRQLAVNKLIQEKESGGSSGKMQMERLSEGG